MLSASHQGNYSAVTFPWVLFQVSPYRLARRADGDLPRTENDGGNSWKRLRSSLGLTRDDDDECFHAIGWATGRACTMQPVESTAVTFLKSSSLRISLMWSNSGKICVDKWGAAVHTCVFVLCIASFSSSGYSTLGSDCGIMTSSLTNSPFANAQGHHCVPLYSHQPSSTVQWMPHALDAERSAGYTSRTQFSQVYIAYVWWFLWVVVDVLFSNLNCDLMSLFSSLLKSGRKTKSAVGIISKLVVNLHFYCPSHSAYALIHWHCCY